MNSDSIVDLFLGLGGVILIETSKVKVHVMPDFSKMPLRSESDLNNWLKFFEVSTPLVALGYLVSHDPVIKLLDIYFLHLHYLFKFTNRCVL